MDDPLRPATEIPAEARSRRWTSRVIALLLVVQAMLLFGISAVVLNRINWQLEVADPVLSSAALDGLLLVLLLGPLGVFELVSAVGMWLGGGGAWLRAMIVQGILLIFCLSSYIANRRESFIYLLMLTCIIIVLYLNTNDVRLAYQSHIFERRERSG